MKKSNLMFLAGILFCACNSSTPEQTQTLPADIAPATENVPVQQTPENPASAAQVPVQQNTTSAPVTTANPNAGLTGMNPAHGQPGHRCDIAVGAPLNSPPGNTASSTPAVTQSAPTLTNTPTSVQPSAAPTVTAPGMNPPHGQPGHDCTIAVGAPLKK